MRLGRGANGPAFCQLFTSRIMPDASTEQADAFNDLCGIHCALLRDDERLMNPFDEGDGWPQAYRAPASSFFQSNNHILLPGEPALHRFIEGTELFLGSKSLSATPIETSQTDASQARHPLEEMARNLTSDAWSDRTHLVGVSTNEQCRMHHGARWASSLIFSAACPRPTLRKPGASRNDRSGELPKLAARPSLMSSRPHETGRAPPPHFRLLELGSNDRPVERRAEFFGAFESKLDTGARS
jgi:hypothetical protein